MTQDAVRISMHGGVTVTRYVLDWAKWGPDYNELATVTLQRFNALPVIEMAHRYLNPMFSLFSPQDVAERTFLTQANRACKIWLRQFKKVAGSRRVRLYQRQESSPGARMLLTSGMLILSGKLAHTKRLNQK